MDVDRARGRSLRREVLAPGDVRDSPLDAADSYRCRPGGRPRKRSATSCSIRSSRCSPRHAIGSPCTAAPSPPKAEPSPSLAQRGREIDDRGVAGEGGAVRWLPTTACSSNGVADALWRSRIILAFVCGPTRRNLCSRAPRRRSAGRALHDEAARRRVSAAIRACADTARAASTFSVRPFATAARRRDPPPLGGDGDDRSARCVHCLDVGDRTRISQVFDLVGAIAAGTPIRTLAFRRNLSKANELRDAVLADLHHE